MAHFAKIDENNIVTRVVVVCNTDTSDNQGNEVEEIGQQFLKNLYGQETNWIKASYNSTIRKNYPGNGYKYDEALDAFIPPKPYDSWILDEITYQYVAPVPFPEGVTAESGITYRWDEESLSWQENELYNYP